MFFIQQFLFPIVHKIPTNFIILNWEIIISSSKPPIYNYYYYHQSQLKVQYRKKYQDLLAQQENLKILRQYVEKSRSKLLTEFNEWYKITYVGADERKDGLSSGDQVRICLSHNLVSLV